MRLDVEKLCLEEVILRFRGEEGDVIFATLQAVPPCYDRDRWTFYIGTIDKCMSEALENIEQILKLVKEHRKDLERVLSELQKIVEG